MTVCLEVVEGCPDCEAEAAYKGDHECDELCRFWGKQKQNGSEFHERSHQPHRCDHCGFVLSDKQSPAKYKTRLCRGHYCTEWYCPNCGGIDLSEGPVNCPTCGSFGYVTRERISRMHRQYARRR